MIERQQSQRWLWDVLLQSGASVTALQASADGADVALTVTDNEGEHAVRLRIKTWPVIRPSTVTGVLSHLSPVLVVTDEISQDTVTALQPTRHSWVSRRALPSGLRGELRIGDLVLSLRKDADLTTSPTGHGRGRPGNGSARILQELLWRGSATQLDLTSTTGMSQARVSQVLTKLADAAWLGTDEGRPTRWSVKNPGGLIDHWLEIYRPARGVATYWYSLDTPRTQVEKAVNALGAPSWVSGAMAADVLAPWSVPHSALIYTTSAQGLAEAAFVSSRADEATIQVIVTGDPSIRPTPAARQVIDGLSSSGWAAKVADPLVVLWDLRHARDIDAEQSAQHLRGALVSHLEGRRVR